MGRGPQRGEVVQPVDGRDHDPQLTSVHVHHAGDAAAPVCERVDLTDEEHHEYGSSERAGQRSTCLKAAPECALHEAWGDELGGAGTVGSLLESTR